MSRNPIVYAGDGNLKKRCAGGCGRMLPLEAYNLDSYAADGRQSYCPVCKARWTRAAAWERKYGLTVQMAAKTLEVQGGNCPICGLRLDPNAAVVDHDHDDEEVLGLLHGPCNSSPPTKLTREAWARYHENPPVRQANGGKPLYRPGTREGQLQAF